VGDLTVLRAKARQSGVYLRVLRNTLARRAVADTAFAVLADQMTGPLIYGISSDPVAAAKVLNDFAKGNEKLVLKAGAYAGKALDKAGVQALASIPSREELLARLLGVMQAPVSGLAIALGALAKQREAAAA
jgi:large subunit ribosomal protein L10